MRRFLEAGRLNSPRGIKGEVRFDCWCDSLDFLSGVRFLYLDNEGKRPLEVAEIRANVSTVIFKGYEDRSLASTLTGRTVYFDRNDVTLPEGSFFYDDILGAEVRDYATNAPIGVVEAVDEGVRGFFYRIKGEKEYYVPAVDAYIVSASPENGLVLRDYEELALGGDK